MARRAPLPRVRVERRRPLPPGGRRPPGRGARPRHRVGARRSQRPDPGQHGGPDRALRGRARGGPDPPRRLLERLGIALDDRPRRPAPGAGAARARAPARSSSARLASSTRRRAPARTSSRTPVAAIRSQTASAPAASSERRSSSASESSRSRARINGRVTVPSSRSVPRALPVRSGGPVTSSTSSRSWKARPISRPKVSQGACLLARLPGLGDQAGALEQASRLQLAAPQVALRRDREVEGVAALRELAEGEGDRGRRQELDLLRCAVARRARRRRARTGGRRRPAPASRPERATTVGLPRRSGAASSTSSWTREAMWTSSIAVAARIAASPAPGPALSRTSIGRRRLPPASSVEPASAASVSPWPSSRRRSRSSTASMRAGSQASAASRTRVTGGGTAERFTSCLGSGPRCAPARRERLRPALAPEWMAMIPPASSEVPDPLEPSRRHQLRQALGRREALHRLGQVRVGVAVAGDRAQQRHDPVEPQRVEGRERRPPRLGDLEDHQPAAGLQHPRQLRSPRSRSARLRAPKPTVTASKAPSG